jgi:hypothetical protein
VLRSVRAPARLWWGNLTLFDRALRSFIAIGLGETEIVPMCPKRKKIHRAVDDMTAGGR